jgi:hypothetical protein
VVTNYHYRAQNILSQKCQSTLLTIALNPQASSCLNTQSVMSIVLDSKKALADPVGTLNTWVTGMCGGDYCSDQTLSDITKNVSADCSDEFAYRGYDIKTDLSSVIAQVQQVYPTARNISCLTEYVITFLLLLPFRLCDHLQRTF